MKDRRLVDRFLSKIALDAEGHWIWTACKTKRGYGQMRVTGKTIAAHRVSYEMHYGPIPAEMEIDHLCRITACVNPQHLEAVTHAENVARGRVGHIQRTQTHCVNGHAFDSDNTVARIDGSRGCRQCMRERSARWRNENIDLIRERDRIAKRKGRDAKGVPTRWPGRIHPRSDS